MVWLAPTFSSSGGLGTLQTFSTAWGPITIANSGPQPAATSTFTPTPNPTPVSPTFDPKIEANALYGKPMTLAAIGSIPVRFGGSPAPIVGPYINSGKVDFLVSMALIVPVDGTRKLFNLYLDQELAWSSATGWDGTGAQPGDAIYHAETFDLAFRQGTLTQAVCSLESAYFPGDENAYRPQVLIEIRNLTFQRFMDQSGRPVPYVSADIGDFSDGRGADEQINLGEALELIAHSPWAGYTASTFEAVNITDAVDGILIKDNFTVIDLCRSVTRIYRNIDLLQSDKLRVKDRGNVNPDFVFDRDSIIGGEGAVPIMRAGATTQRRELELITIDPDQDYTGVPSLAQIPRNPFTISAAVGKETITSPLVMDANTRQALVTFAQQYEENARKKVAFKVAALGYEIEPGDLFALPDTVSDGIDGEVFKCTQTSHGANYVGEVEGEAILRCAIFTGEGWTPADDDLLLWLKGDDLLGGDGDSIATWPDASGNGRNFTQATSVDQPNLETDELNNLNVVHFDGSNSEYLVGPDLDGIATSATLFYVVRAGADPTIGTVTGPLHFGSHASNDHYPHSDGIIYNGDCSTSRKTVGDPSPALTNWNIVGTTSALADWHYYLNGTDIFNTGTNAVGLSGSPSIGVAHSGVQTSFNWTGDVAEVILYNGVLSVADRQKTEGYLAHKWGIASVLDAAHPYKTNPP